MEKNFWAKFFLACLLIASTVWMATARIMDGLPRKTVMGPPLPRNSVRLILDPGHGGADGGAVSVTGTYESRLNLEIALRAQAMAALYGIDPVMTRTSERIDYPESAATIHAKKVADTKAREALVNGTENAVMISIHQNKYTTAGPTGSQVFYAPTQGSVEMAENIQTLLSQLSQDNKRGIVKIDKNVYLMNHVNCPAVLVECGFLSNFAEARLLETPEYQSKLAAAVVGGFIQGIS